MNKIMILGGNGQLGSDINYYLISLGYHTFPLNHQDVDIGIFDQIETIIHSINPDIIINTAAFHHVELCEANPGKAFLINAEAPEYISKICKSLGIKFIHFSTDYVFDGNQKTPYLETDEPNPLNIYGKSKLAGENKILNVGGDSLILRVSALYGQNPCRAKNGLNFIQLMLKLAHDKGEVSVVDDEFISPTSTLAIAHKIPELIRNQIHGIVHLTSEGYCSWYEFAHEIFNYTHTNVKLNRAHSNDFPSKVTRPKYSVLENMILKQYNMIEMPHWKSSLHEYLNLL